MNEYLCDVERKTSDGIRREVDQADVADAHEDDKERKQSGLGQDFLLRGLEEAHHVEYQTKGYQ